MRSLCFAFLLLAGCGSSPPPAAPAPAPAPEGPVTPTGTGWPDLDGDGVGERLVIDRGEGRAACALEEGSGWVPRNTTVTVEGSAGERLAGPIVIDGAPELEVPEGDPPPCASLVSGPWNRREAVGGVLLRSLAPLDGFEVVFAALRSTCHGPCGVEVDECTCDVEATYVEQHQLAHGLSGDVHQRRVDDDALVLRVRADCGDACRVVADLRDGTEGDAFAEGLGPTRAPWRTFAEGDVDREGPARGRQGVRLPVGRHVVWVLPDAGDPIGYEVSAPQDHDDVTLSTSDP